MANKNLSELPFQPVIDDNTLLHTHNDKDRNSTFSRLWAWVQGKITPTNTVTCGILVQDNDQNLQLINTNDFLKSTVAGQLNAMQPINKASLIAEGYTELEIKMY